jgi:hypothetical protein
MLKCGWVKDILNRRNKMKDYRVEVEKSGKFTFKKSYKIRAYDGNGASRIAENDDIDLYDNTYLDLEEIDVYTTVHLMEK